MLYTKIRTQLLRNKKQFLLKDEYGNTTWRDSKWVREADKNGHTFDGLWLSKSKQVLEGSPKEADVRIVGVANSRVKQAQGRTVLSAAQDGGFKVLLGSELEAYADYMLSGIKQERNYIAPLCKSVLKMPAAKLHILFGVRSTGKTRGLCHCVKSLIRSDVSVNSLAFIDCMRAKSSALLESTIEGLRRQGVLYFFVDEISALTDIIDTLKGIADFQTGTAAIVVAGTDSYVFAEAVTDRLYHRHITYAFSKMTLTEYLRVVEGGTVDSALRECGVFDDEFSTAGKAFDSLETSVAANIHNSIVRNKSYFTDYKSSSLRHQDVCKLFDLTSYELLYLIISVFIDSVHPKADGRLMDIEDFVKDPQLHRVFRNMTGARFSDTVDYKELLVKVARTYKKHQIGTMRECLQSLGLIKGLTNVLSGVHGVDITGAEVEFVCLVQNLFYTLSTLYNGKEDIGSLFENFVVAQTVIILGAYGMRYEVGFARFQDSSVPKKTKREVDIVITDRTTGKGYLIEVKSASVVADSHLVHLLSDSFLQLFPGAFKWVCYRGVDDAVHHGIKYINVASFVKILESGDLSKLAY